jgi:hypothetical protein
MLYPLSYGRSAATGIPRAQRRERLPVEPAQTEIPVRNVAKDYRLTLPRPNPRPPPNNQLQRWTLGTQALDLGHGLAQLAEPFVSVLPHQPHAPGERLRT